MSQVSLPSEISCSVVRCLDKAEDKRTLFACSLTCKEFLSTSRKTIFETIQIFWPPATRSFDSQFLELIQSSPELGSSVRGLHLTFPNSPGTTYVPNAGADLARGLPNVTDLQVRFLSWDNIDADCRAGLLSGFKAVTRLELTYPKFAFSHEATDFISSFPLLTDLHIEGDAWRSVVPHPNYSPLPVNLTTVAVSAHEAGVFTQLMRLESHPKVQNLSLEFVSDDHNYNVTSLLETLGDDLRELKFLNSVAMRAGACALRNSEGEHTPESSSNSTYI